MKEQNLSDFESCLIASGNSSKIGKLNGQRFYAARSVDGVDFQVPFARKKFSALINVAGKISEDRLREVGLKLLRHGMVCAVCISDAAERISKIIDELIDEGGFVCDGYTPYSQIESGSLTDTLEFFVLPTDLTKVSLILTLGSDADGDNTVTAANRHFNFENFDESEDLLPEDDGLAMLTLVAPVFACRELTEPEYA